MAIARRGLRRALAAAALLAAPLLLAACATGPRYEQAPLTISTGSFSEEPLPAASLSPDGTVLHVEFDDSPYLPYRPTVLHQPSATQIEVTFEQERRDGTFPNMGTTAALDIRLDRPAQPGATDLTITGLSPAPVQLHV